MTQDAKTLKPCPFCGGKPFLNYAPGWEPGTADTSMANVSCTGCFTSQKYASTSNAIEAWNRRALRDGEATEGDDKRLRIGDYPIGTKAHGFNGGYWLRTESGWKASGGDTFPRYGGDAVEVELPRAALRNAEPGVGSETIVKALQFYADPANWIDTPSWDGDPECFTPAAIPVVKEDGLAICDCGDRARAALSTTPPVAQTGTVGISDAETYEIGKRDGYEDAIQDLDLATGGDGEFKGSTFSGETVDVPTMKARIIERFAALSAPTVEESL